MDNNYIAEMYIEETVIPKRIIIENMLLTKLGIKTCSSLTLPGDLPNGQEKAEEINRMYQTQVEEYENKFSLRKLSLSPRKMVEKAVKHKQQILKKIFDQYIYQDEAYLAFISWGRVVGLLGIEYEIRPSIREVVLVADHETKKEMEKLLQFRLILTKDYKKNFNENTPVQVLLYPEELNPRYVEEIGKMTGYPECCVRAFLADRKKGDNPSVRGALDYYTASEQKKPESWAYFTGGFVPCRPDCRAAQDKGQKSYRLLKEISPEIAKDYQEILNENAQSFASEAIKLKEEIRRIQRKNASK